MAMPARRLLRREPDAAGSRTARDLRRRHRSTNHFVLPASAPTPSIRTRSCRTSDEFVGRRRARGDAEHDVSASATSTATSAACSKTSRTARWWRTSSRRPERRLRQRRVHPDESDAARRRSTRRCSRSRRSSTACSFDDPVHKYDAVEFTLNRRILEQLVGAGVVPLVAPARQLRGLLPRRQRPVGSGHLVALRLPDQRSELHVDRRPQFGYQGDIRFLGDHERDPAARSPAPGQAVRQLRCSDWD